MYKLFLNTQASLRYPYSFLFQQRRNVNKPNSKSDQPFLNPLKKGYDQITNISIVSIRARKRIQ